MLAHAFARDRRLYCAKLATHVERCGRLGVPHVELALAAAGKDHDHRLRSPEPSGSRQGRGRFSTQRSRKPARQSRQAADGGQPEPRSAFAKLRRPTRRFSELEHHQKLGLGGCELIEYEGEPAMAEMLLKPLQYRRRGQRTLAWKDSFEVYQASSPKHPCEDSVDLGVLCGEFIF